MQSVNSKIEPFLKWAGGKRWFVSKYQSILEDVGSYNNYFEPFLGGGAVFFHLNPKTGIISDLNGDLINTYQTIKSAPFKLYEKLIEYQALHSEEFYYNMRSSEPSDKLSKAARFLYLNRTCWNGLYRVNNKGQFNVPIGSKDKIIFENENFESLSKRLEKIDIIECDFEKTLEQAQKGDFVFIDPPYTVKHNNNGFIKYNENIFSWKDQIRLKESVEKCLQRDVKILITNANHQSISELYKNIGKHMVLDRQSVIAGNKMKRGIYNELIIRCW